MEQSNLGTDQKKNQNGLSGVIYRKKKKKLLKKIKGPVLTCS